MADIFLSYASADRIRARAIATLFEKAGWSVWMDRSIAGGTEWTPALEEELERARCVVVLWTRDSVRSEWVQREARAARDRRVLLPVLLHPVTPPEDLAEVQAVAATAWIDDSTAYELNPVVERVAAILGCDSPDMFTAPLEVASAQVTKVEIVEATFEFCAARLQFFHERRSGQVTETTLKMMQVTYDRLVQVLAPVSSDDIHGLLMKHETAFTPRDEPEPV